MLASLAGVMRIDLVLTLNFDDLIERAFAAARNTLEVIEVPLEGGLPEHAVLSRLRALVKLHGGRTSLRADYSIDTPPSEEDKRHFLSYLTTDNGRYTLAVPNSGGPLYDRISKPRELPTQNHLLVTGFSASDWRIREFIAYAILNLDAKFKVFWICHTNDDVSKVKKFVNDFGEPGPGNPATKSISIIHHTNVGLLLFQTYQTLRKSLPPLGSIFPSISRQTFPPLSTAGDQLKLTDWSGGLSKDIEEIRSAKRKLIVAMAAPDRGLTSRCARVFREREAKGDACLWIDMDDISSTDNLYEVLLESFHYKLGIEDWIPATKYSDVADPKSFPNVEEFVRLAGTINKDWVVFINAREVPGANTHKDKDEAPDPNETKAERRSRLAGWLDNPPDERKGGGIYEDRSDNHESFKGFLSALAEQPKKVTVVLICHDHLKIATDPPAESTTNICELPRAFDPENKVKKLVGDWQAKDDGRVRFLRALSLLQRPRLMATIWSEAAITDPDADVQGWLGELEKTGIIGIKPGGLIWFHAECRNELRERLKSAGEHYETPDIHTKLAQWYERVLDASDTPSAALESAYHFCKAAQAYVKPDGHGKHKEIATNIEAATAILRANTLLIQTHGYSRGSCRRLESLALDAERTFNFLTNITSPHKENASNAIADLWLVIAEIMRAVAREVGEDAKAYYRHHLVGWLLFSRETNGNWTWTLTKNVATETVKEGGYSRLKGDLLVALKAGQDIQGIHPNPNWLRWRRWQAMLMIESRSQEKIEAMFDGVVGKIEEESEAAKHRVEFDPRTTSGGQRARIEVVRIIEQSVEMAMIANSAILRNDPTAVSPFPEVKILFRIERGIRLIRKVRDQDKSSDSHETLIANWCEVRLLMHRSVVLSGRGDYTGAFGILGEAEARLRMVDPKRSRVELAMVDLHRAEARIRQAESLPCWTGQSLVELLKNEPESIRERLGREIKQQEALDKQTAEGYSLHSAEYKQAKKELNDLEEENGPLREAMRNLRALSDDALRFLNRAEPVLRERRRNVWWTTWYFDRRLRAISISVWASILEKGSPIPHFGLEAVMRANKTEAERLLDDACRMIRVDAYRLATILEAFLSSVQALDTRLELEYSGKYADVLPLRRGQLRDGLRRGLGQLDEVLKRRHSGAGGSPEARIDQIFMEYIKAQGKAVSDYLNNLNDKDKDVDWKAPTMTGDHWKISAH